MEKFLRDIKQDKTQAVLQQLDSTQLSLDQTDKKGNTALHLAIENQNLQIMQALINYQRSKIDVNQVHTKEKTTPLLAAIQLNFVEGIELLLNSKADINFQHEGGKTVLHYVAQSNQLNILKILLKFNADVNAQNSEGQTPLHLAIAFGSTESAAELITFQGTDFRLIDHLGNHVLHECILNGAADLFHAITERLEQENKIGFLINESNQDGNTLLHLSEIHSRSSIKQLLLDNYAKWGIDSNSKKNKKGQTPTQIHEKLIEREREIEEMKVVNRKERLENEQQRREQRKKEVEEQLRREEEERKRKEEEEAKLQQQEEAKQEENQEVLVEQQQKNRFFVIVILVLVIAVMFMIFRREEIARRENIIY